MLLHTLSSPSTSPVNHCFAQGGRDHSPPRRQNGIARHAILCGCAPTTWDNPPPLYTRGPGLRARTARWREISRLLVSTDASSAWTPKGSPSTSPSSCDFMPSCNDFALSFPYPL